MNSSKGNGILGVFVLFLMLIMPTFVSAKDYSGDAAQVASAIRAFFSTLLMSGSNEIFSRVFLALLLGMVIYSVISVMFKESRPLIKNSITVIVTILALMGLPSGFLKAVMIQYGAMGATILVIIPFIIILTFSMQSKNLLIARATWLVYATYYFSMYFYEIFATNGLGWHNWLTTSTIPYIAGFIAGVFMVVMVGVMRTFVFKGKMESLEEVGENKVKERKNRLRIEWDRLKADDSSGKQS